MKTRAFWWRKIEPVVLGVAGLLLVALLWQLASSLRWLNPLLVSSPEQIFRAAARLSANGELWGDLGITVVEFAISFFAASFVGILLGLIMGWYRRAEYTFEPFLWLLFSTPLIAFYPLLLVWFGFGFNTVVVMGFLFAFIPITINTMAGVKHSSPVLVRAAKSFGANNRQILMKVALPSALPMIVTGLRIGVERALIGVIVGEMFCSNSGLGFHISYYGARLETANLFVALVIVILLGLILTQAFRILESRLMKWRQN